MDLLLNVYAFFLPLILFSFWGTLGYATLSLLRTQRNILQNLLLAPTIGFAITGLFVFLINRHGIPVRHFALPLTLFLLFISMTVLWWRKPFFPGKLYLPFFILFCLGLFLTGSPLLMYGFNWLSFANDDMANYCLGATRFLNHGYYELPIAKDLVLGTDFSLFYWFLHVPNAARSGSELILSWITALTHFNSIQLFMPVILAFHLTLISITGALVCSGKNKQRIALLACLFVTFSPLTTLGTLYQLIAQVTGLCILSACIILLFQPFSIHKKFYIILQSLLIAAMVACFLIFYPELLPVLGTSFIFYFCIYHLKGKRLNQSFYLTLAIAALLIICCMNTYLLGSLLYLIKQLTTNHQLLITSGFHYFLIPSGLANFWGLLPLTKYYVEPMTSISIVIGIFLFIFASIAIVKLMWQRVLPNSFVVLLMLFSASIFFIKTLGFPLFKLAMCLQPFLLGIIAIALLEWIKNIQLKTIIIVSLLTLNFFSMSYYVYRSHALAPGSFSEITYASSKNINKEFTQSLQKIPQETVLLSDDFNISLIKFLAMQAHPHRFVFFTTPRLFYILSLAHEPQWIKKFKMTSLYEPLIFPHEKNEFIQLFQQLYKIARFDLHTANNPIMDFYHFNFYESAEQSILVQDSELRNSLNRYHHPHSETSNFLFADLQQIKNHIVFVESSLGRIYFAQQNIFTNEYEDKTRSFFNIEKDPFFPDKTMQSLGRYLLFRILNPTQTFRLTFTISNTFSADGINKIPSASAIGNARIALPTMGRGSARVFSSPFSPQMIDQVAYIAIDMNVSGKTYKHERKGLMKLYGTKIEVDPRYIVTTSRDISLISEEEYKKLDSLAVVKDFPQDLANPNLEYSGIYEDGWISEDAFFVLKPTTSHTHLVIKGSLPKIEKDFLNSNITLLLNGKKIFQQQISPGEFNLTIPIQEKEIKPHKIELHFSHLQRLPNGDDRPVAALIHFIGWT